VELRERRALNQGFERALAQGLEIVASVFLFGLLGWWLDRVFDTRPILMILFGLLGVFAISMRSYLWYKASMDSEEKGKPWKRPSQ
jgi:F0F1-type ATP synthase assembly protein I